MIETNNIVLLSKNYGLYAGKIKVVGTSFRDQKTLATGQTILREFFKTTSSDSFGIINLERTALNIGYFENFVEQLNKFVKIEREPNNPYDPNAIVVYVNYDNRFMKVGYFPKDIAEIVVERKYKSYLVGYEKDGRGMILSMIFEIQVIESIVSPVYNENKNLGFMSLNKMRKRLCK